MVIVIGILALGVAAGVLSGLAGIGGGVLVVPILVFVFGLTQHTAQGTSLGFLALPIMVLPAYQYWKRGQLDVRFALLLAAGFVVGSFLSSRWVAGIPAPTLKKGFGVLLLLLSARYLLLK